MEKICGIYKITSPSRRIYIGKSVNCKSRKRDYKKGRSKSQRRLHNSILKYGWDAHIFEIIHKCSLEELNYWEKYYIDLFQTFNTENGLNLMSGGGHCTHSEETRKKISDGNRGKKRTEETKEKIRLSHIGKKLPPCTESRKEKMRIALRGRVISKETREKISKALTGIKRSKETMEKLRKINIGRKNSQETIEKQRNAQRGDKNGFYGKKHSKESKKEISQKLKIIKNLPEQIFKNSQSHLGLQVGNKNGMSKIVLNTLSGIYYQCAREAAESTNIRPSYLSRMLIGERRNKTSFIYA